MNHGCIQFQANVSHTKPVEAKKHIPRGWSAAYVGGQDYTMTLTWEPDVLEALTQLTVNECRLRITNATDYRDEQSIEVMYAQTKEHLGAIEVRYSYAFQFFELVLPRAAIARVVREGIILSCKATPHQLWIFNDQNEEDYQQYFVPHLLVTTEPLNKKEAAIASLLSLKSLQPFGWIEGSVLDGIDSFISSPLEEQARKALGQHLNRYITSDGRLEYEDLHGNIADGAFTTIEATLPVAIVAKHNPQHPLIDKAIQFFQQNTKDSALIIDHDMVSAEGCYTVAYPLAVIAQASGNEQLAKQAVEQLLLRKKYLAHDEEHIYLRFMLNSGEHTFKSWSRAYGWYFLGFVKTYTILANSSFDSLDELEEIREEIKRVAKLVLQYRQKHGLWNVFLHQPDGLVETSGSSAIAAALAIAANHGIIEGEYFRAAQDCYTALLQHLTPDGLLHQVSQHNAGGMKLQLSDYRVLSQMGLGLWGQLHCALYYR